MHSVCAAQMMRNEIWEDILTAHLHFSVPNGRDKESIDATLAKKFTFVVDEPVSETWTFFDTFDWRLSNRSLLLYEVGSNIVLHDVADGEQLSSDATIQPPAFSWDFDGPFQERLAAAIKLRALLSLAQVRAESHTYHILNEDEKTVARLEYIETRCAHEKDGGERLGAYVTLRPVRGYQKYTQLLVQQLDQPELDASVQQDAYQKALDVVGKRVGDYSTSLDLHLDPDMRSDQAGRAIFRRLLAIMRANEAGVLADTDTEFLHDFRVAVRKTRSALSQIKRIFPDETTARWKADFRFIGGLTNELRDLDVYLLSEDDYRALLPPSIQDDVGPLFAYLRTQRSAALEKVRAGLTSDDYARILSEWETFLNEPVMRNPEAPNATMPVLKLARKRMYRQYRKIVRDGNNILANTEDRLLHELRIECKKLRYLLEFFTSLFPPDEMELLIKQLKRLQDNLGEFNDLSVQEEYLLHIAGELPVVDMASRRALVATGYLVDTMERRRQVVKEGFAETFAIFTSPANQKLFRELLANGGA